MRGRGEVMLVSNTRLADFEQLFQLEARRNFLREQWSTLTGNTVHAVARPVIDSSVLDIATKASTLQEDIDALEQQLRSLPQTDPSIAALIELILKPKQGSDNDGISRTIGLRLAQDSQKPFVHLDEQGAHVFWNHESNATICENTLRAAGIECTVLTRTLSIDLLPEQLDDQPVRDLRTDQTYQGAGCRDVVISHRNIDRLLAITQFHPYVRRLVINDWYQARSLHQAECLTRELLTAPEDASLANDDLPVYFTDGTQRVRLSDTEDLVRVTLAADIVADENVRHHVVILLDDSVSMDGHSMAAANQALRKFLTDLAPDTLVSIQPFNAKTLAYRQTAFNMQQALDHYCNTPATGSTPLVEMLANSALFLRTAGDLIITQEEMDNTVVVLLTDGQANGKMQDVISAMQATSGERAIQMPCIDIPGCAAEQFVSYGAGAFQCRTLPAVLPVSIGEYADQIFMRELAETFHAPEAYVKTDSSMQTDIDHAMGLLHHMRARIPLAYLGLGYTHLGSSAYTGYEAHHLYNARERDFYFRIPHDATNIELCTQVNTVAAIERDRLSVAVDSPETVRRYLKQQLFELTVHFTQKGLSLFNSSAFPRGSRGAPLPEVAALPSEKFEALRQETLSQAHALRRLSNTQQSQQSQQLIAEIDLFISQVEQASQNHASLTNISPTRGAVAGYTQHRSLGQAAHGRPIRNRSDVDRLMDYIPNDLSSFQAMLDSNPSLVNSIVANQYHATPLISLVASPYNRDYDPFIDAILHTPGLDLTISDALGNTALHRAAWNASPRCVSLIEAAVRLNQMNALKQSRNKNAVGATHLGETVLDHIRAKYSKENSKMLQRAMGDEFQAGSGDSLNQHLPEYWNTPLMQALRDLRDASVDEKAHRREEIKQQLTHDHSLILSLAESNFEGDTLLHYAIWYKEFELAGLIVQRAIQTNQIQEVLAARNSVGLNDQGIGGEVPHLNLAAIGKDVVGECATTHALIACLLRIELTRTPRLIQVNDTLDTVLKRLSTLLTLSINRCTDPNITAALIQKKLIYTSARDRFLNLKKWLELCQAIVPYLDARQQAEFAHLLQVHGKELQGYSSFNFLRAAPSQQLDDVITACEGVSLDGIDGMLEVLKAIKANPSDGLIDALLTIIDDMRKKDGLSMPHSDLLTRVRGCLVQYRGYLTGELATLAHLAQELSVELDLTSPTMGGPLSR